MWSWHYNETLFAQNDNRIKGLFVLCCVVLCCVELCCVVLCCVVLCPSGNHMEACYCGVCNGVLVSKKTARTHAADGSPLTTPHHIPPHHTTKLPPTLQGTMKQGHTLHCFIPNVHHAMQPPDTPRRPTTRHATPPRTPHHTPRHYTDTPRRPTARHATPPRTPHHTPRHYTKAMEAALTYTKSPL
jgi:hypothetical protein